MVAKERQDTGCEVLVVGAGPTGLMAATLLKRLGVRVRIIDQRPEVSRESRAFAVQARSLELFLSLGLADTLLGKGVIDSAVDFYVGGRHVGGLDFDEAGSPDTPYQFLFLVPQSETEAILIDDLAHQGVEVERGIEVTGLEQDSDGVVTRGTAAGRDDVTIRSSYVIGADGAHSKVRKALGFSFEGEQYAQTFMLADCRVEWPLDHNRFRIFMHGPSIGLFLPLHGSSLSRVMATDQSGKADEGGPAATDLDLAELQAAFSETTGMKLELSAPAWITRYRVHHRGVDHYAKGRVFVAGDAAHIHSPAGGQGMNTGLQDAANLAWKLAVVLRCGADPDLLETYDAERRPVGAQVVAATDRLFRVVAGKTGWEATVRDWIARPVSAAISHLTSAQHRVFRAVSELDIAYDGSRIGEDEASKLDGGPIPGRRAPNAAIARHRDVFDLISGYTFTVLALSRKPLDAGETDQISSQLGTIGRETDRIKTHLVARVPFGRDPHVVFVEKADVFDAYGLKEADSQAIYVVRPDGYVAWRGDGVDVERCRRFLARFGFGASTRG